MKKIFIFLLLLLTLNSTNVEALNCKDPQNGFEISQCLGQEERIVDDELNKVYKQFLKEDSRYKKQLTQAELAWIKFRDLECKFQSLSYQGGTEESREYSRTFIRLTKERIQHLKNALRKIG